ncbi:hypothetical protein [Marinobacter persicus]|uniref:Uncharacterized protein n=1 Tax=Marinobacter persicus TaxID=930118 RepID=A0A2S6G1R9_9GAMM|nr:hypothetical protein [Marinobacter persicus]PPK49084.1 hypothetical protein BY455_1652 [Marinobacter persicus]PPK50548.1 hypothetical protein B0H24_10682 [Marinobacter persicus]PPK54822.1 hypothetical protein BY454_1672 [Marinobacter persicus]
MSTQHQVILDARFDQSPIRSVGPDASEINVGLLADTRVKKLLDAITALCSELAKQCFPEEQVTFLHSDFVVTQGSQIQHTSRVYSDGEASRALVDSVSMASFHFCRAVIQNGADLFNMSSKETLTPSQENLLNKFSDDYIAANSGTHLKFPFVIQFPQVSTLGEVAAQGHIEKAPEVEHKIHNYHGIAKIDGGSIDKKTITMRLSSDADRGDRIITVQATTTHELSVAFRAALSKSKKAIVAVHQVKDGKHKLHWRLKAIKVKSEDQSRKLELEMQSQQ